MPDDGSRREPVYVVASWTVPPERSKRPGYGAFLRRGDHLLSCSRLLNEDRWYIDAMFPLVGPAIHNYGWGERSVSPLYPVREDMARALDGLFGIDVSRAAEGGALAVERYGDALARLSKT